MHIRSLYFKSVHFDLDEPSVSSQVSQDYELVGRTIKNDGFQALTGKMGTLLQSRTKGQANTTTRAFYARTQVAGKILGMCGHHGSEPSQAILLYFRPTHGLT